MRSFLLVFSLFAAAGAARADGLIDHLPKDGVGVVFELEQTYEFDGKKGSASGTVTMSSVGREVVKDEPCRWIELVLVTRGDEGSKRFTYKLLIPEKFLRGGECPKDHILKCWWARRDDRPEILDKHPKDQRWTLLPMLLAGPVTRPKRLETAVVDSPLGKVECAGVSGSLTIEQEERKWQIIATTRFHPEAPFGVVSSRMEFDLELGDKRGKGTQTLKLIEVRKNVKSAWPDCN